MPPPPAPAAAALDMSHVLHPDYVDRAATGGKTGKASAFRVKQAAAQKQKRCVPAPAMRCHQDQDTPTGLFVCVRSRPCYCGLLASRASTL